MPNPSIKRNRPASRVIPLMSNVERPLPSSKLPLWVGLGQSIVRSEGLVMGS
jgi:hypothetical protein